MQSDLPERCALTTSDEVLGNGYTRREIANAITPRRLGLIVLPTERCNLRCEYCYEDYAIGKMTPETQRAVELFIQRRVPRLEVFSLSWFGGEPLVAKDVVLRLSRFANEQCTEHGVGLNGSLTTNAYLLDKQTFEDLLELKQNNYQITLDGWREAHDAVRRFADGRGSFDRIWENLLAAKTVESNFTINLRIHVRRDNIETLPELMQEIAKAFGNDARFSLKFQHVRNLGGEGGQRIKSPVGRNELYGIEATLRDVYQRSLAAIGKAVVESDGALENGAAQDMLDVQPAPKETRCSPQAEDSAAKFATYICYAAQPNSLIIRADGRIAKCTVHFGDDMNTLGHIRDDGTLDIDNAKIKPWIRGLEFLNAADLRCPAQHMKLGCK